MRHYRGMTNALMKMRCQITGHDPLTTIQQIEPDGSWGSSFMFRVKRMTRACRRCGKPVPTGLTGPQLRKGVRY